MPINRFNLLNIQAKAFHLFNSDVPNKTITVDANRQSMRTNPKYNNKQQ